MKKSVILLLLLIWPHHLAAMTIEQFDRMVAEDQRHYLMFLVKEAQALLIELGQPELAKNVERQFREVAPGTQRSAGEVQFEATLAESRTSKVKFTLWHSPTSEVEFVLYHALFDLGIKPAPAFSARFGEVTRNRAFYQKEIRAAK